MTREQQESGDAKEARGKVRGKKRVRKEGGCGQAPLEFVDPLGSDLMREGLKKRAINAALCMMHGKSSRQLQPIVIPSKQEVSQNPIGFITLNL